MDTRDKPEYDADLMVDTRVTPEYDNRKRMCLKPEYDHKRSLIKNLECIETAESGVDKVVSSCEKNPNTLLENLDSVRECAGIFKRRVQKEYTSAKISSRHQLNEFSLGRSMIEMLGVLAIIGVLSVGGIAGYSKAMETYKINKLKQAITEIVTNTRTLYAQQNPQNKYQGLDYSTAKNAGILTVDLHNSDIYPSLSGNYYNSYKTFLIELSWISEKECVALATADWGTTSSTGFYSLAISDYSHNYEEVIGCETTGENNFGSGNKTYIARSGQLPLSPAIAAKYCALNSAKGFDVNQGHNSFISLQFQ